jgi:hypothetical protein
MRQGICGARRPADDAAARSMVLGEGGNAGQEIKALDDRQSGARSQESRSPADGAHRRATGVAVQRVIGSKYGSMTRNPAINSRAIQRLCTPLMGIRARRGARAARIDPPGVLFAVKHAPPRSRGPHNAYSGRPLPSSAGLGPTTLFPRIFFGNFAMRAVHAAAPISQLSKRTTDVQSATQI